MTSDEGPELVLRDVELAGARTDVRILGGAVAAIGPSLAAGPGVTEVDGRGGALLPGLHDHHLHLLATAAARRSVQAGPPAVRDIDDLARALQAARSPHAPDEWIRAVGYHESVAGPLDREVLDRLVPDRPVRVQHRGGARWVLNSHALGLLGLEGERRPELVRDAEGRLTGQVHRGDAWLRERLPAAPAPDLAELGSELTRFGITGVTDTTPYEAVADLDALAAAVRTGELPQRVVVTGAAALAGAGAPPGLTWGPVKVVIDDGDPYPPLDELIEQFAVAHRHGRPVAVHCVTRAALALALATWDEAGAHPGDRVEHGSVVPPELVPSLLRHRLTVVTQPGFVAERGDEYLRDVDPEDVPHLYPCRSLLDAGVPVAASSDAPYTSIDPWRAMRAAVTRTTPGGAVVGAREAVSPARALQLYLGDADDPGGRPRRIGVGATADLCVLDRPLVDALADLDAEAVAGTIVAGRYLPSGR